MGRTCHVSSISPEKVRQLSAWSRESRLTRPYLAYAELSIRPDLNRALVPAHCEPELAARGIHLNGFVPIPLEQLKVSLD